MLAGFGPRVGMDEQTAFMIARCFAGGVGRGLPCGAVSGALMVLGLNGGPGDDGNRVWRAPYYKIAGQFADRFNQRFGSIICRDLLGLDVSQSPDYRIAKERDLFKQLCPTFVQGAAEILEEMLAPPQ